MELSRGVVVIGKVLVAVAERGCNFGHVRFPSIFSEPTCFWREKLELRILLQNEFLSSVTPKASQNVQIAHFQDFLRVSWENHVLGHQSHV